jgi:hypothetical protein
MPYSAPSSDNLQRELQSIEDSISDKIFSILIDARNQTKKIAEQLNQVKRDIETIGHKEKALQDDASRHSRITNDIRRLKNDLKSQQQYVNLLKEESRVTILKIENIFKKYSDDSYWILKRLYARDVLSNEINAPVFARESMNLLAICHLTGIAIKDIACLEGHLFLNALFLRLKSRLIDSSIDKKLLKRMDVIICLPIGSMSSYCKGIADKCKKLNKKAMFSEEDIAFLNGERKYKIITSSAINSVFMFLNISDSILFLDKFNQVVAKLSRYSDKFAVEKDRHINYGKKCNAFHETVYDLLQGNSKIHKLHEIAEIKESGNFKDKVSQSQHDHHILQKRKKPIS